MQSREFRTGPDGPYRFMTPGFFAGGAAGMYGGAKAGEAGASMLDKWLLKNKGLNLGSTGKALLPALGLGGGGAIGGLAGLSTGALLYALTRDRSKDGQHRDTNGTI